MQSPCADPREIGSIPLSAWQRIDASCVEFEKALRQGDSPTIEVWIQSWHSQEREALLRELLAIEVEYRQNAGEALAELDYQRRFSDSVPIVQLVLQEARAGTRRDSRQASQETVAPRESGASVPAMGTFGDYELLEEIARGGMGVVFKARQVSLNRMVAVKMILAGQLASQEAVERFQREARSAAQLDHPAIVAVFDVGTVHGQHYFSMGYVEGPSLADQLAGGPWVPADAARLMLRVAEAVHYAHEKGVIHRDLKPANILLDRDRRPRITDFGLARQTTADELTITGQLVGTPSYMPPEQASGESGLSRPTIDVYALGATFYALLTARPPFQAASVLDTLRLVQEQDAVPPRQLDATIPRDLETITLKCLEKNAERRYPTARALADELDRFLSGKPIFARPIGARERLGRWCRRNPVVATLSAVALSLLALVAVISIIAYYRENVLRAEAETERNITAAALTAEQSARKAEELAKTAERRQREQAERLARSANAQRLAAQANDSLVLRPQRSLLLAVEAVQTTMRAGEPRVAEAEDALRRALANFGGKQLTDNGHGLRTVAISGNGQRVATTSTRGQMQIWDFNRPDPAANSLTLQEPGTARHQPATGLAGAFCPDGRWFALGAYPSKVHLWDLTAEGPNGKSFVLTGHTGIVDKLAFSADGRRLATWSWDKSARVWDLTAPDHAINSAVLRLPQDEPSSCKELAISPDGHWLVTVHMYTKTRLWDLSADDPTGSAVELTAHKDFVWTAAISPDGHWLVTGGNDGTARLWDLTAVKPAESSVVLPCAGAVLQLAISSDSHWLATGHSDKTARVWDLTATDPAAKPQILWGHESAIDAMAFNGDGRQLVTGSWDNTARLWRLDNPEPSAAPLVIRGHDAMVDKVAISPNGRWIVTGSNAMSTRIWDLNSTSENANSPLLRGHTDKIDNLDVSPDGRWLVTGSRDNTAGLWDLKADKHRGRLLPLADGKAQHSLSRFAFSKDGHWLATSWGNTAKLWDTTADNPAARCVDIFGDSRIEAVAISPGDNWLATGGADRVVRVWNLKAANPATQPIELRGHKQPITAMATSPDGQWLITGGADGAVLRWDLSTIEATQEPLALSGHRERVACMTVTADSRWLISGSYDKTARVWDLQSADPAASTVELKGHKGMVVSLATSGDSRWLVTGSHDPTARIWDLGALHPDASSVILRGHESNVYAVAISADAHWVATAGGNSIRLWDRTTLDTSSKPVLLNGHANTVHALSFTPDSQWLASGSWDGTARLWNLRIEDLIEEARDVAGRELTEEERAQFNIALPAK